MSKLFAVFGNPVLHSKSPQLFNSVFERYQIDAFYTRIHVEECRDIIKAIHSLNIVGANITTPFKECIIPVLDELSPEAEQIGAVNTILNDNGYLKGFNTDYLGVTKSIEEAGIDIMGKRCLVLGAGGASRAAVFGLMNAGAEVFISNRTVGKANEIANRLGCNVVSLEEVIADSSPFEIVVSTLLPDVLIEGLNWKSEKMVLLDANYRNSKLSELAKNAGVKVISGDRWLINQAISSFSIFTSLEPPVELLNEAFQHRLNYNHIKVGLLESNTINHLGSIHYDLLVSSVGIESNEIKRIVDDEKDKAIKG